MSSKRKPNVKPKRRLRLRDYSSVSLVNQSKSINTHRYPQNRIKTTQIARIACDPMGNGPRRQADMHGLEARDRSVSKSKLETLEAVDPSSKKMKMSTTQFQNRVYDACSCIPRGKVSTYGVLASALRSSPRAVGQALKRNPFAPKVPCHRVITSSLELGGFGGSWGIDTKKVQRKKAILGSEGVAFDDQGRLVSKASLMTTTELLQAMSRLSKSKKAP